MPLYRWFIILCILTGLMACSPDSSEDQVASPSSKEIESLPPPLDTLNHDEQNAIKEAQEQQRKDLNARVDLPSFTTYQQLGSELHTHTVYWRESNPVLIDELIEQDGTAEERNQYLFHRGKLYAFRWHKKGLIQGKPRTTDRYWLSHPENGRVLITRETVNGEDKELLPQNVEQALNKAHDLVNAMRLAQTERDVIESASATERTGLFIYAENEQIFSDCTTDLVYWIDSRSPDLERMQKAYPYLAPTPYQPTLVVIQARELNESNDSVHPPDYSGGIIWVEQLVSIDSIEKRNCDL